MIKSGILKDKWAFAWFYIGFFAFILSQALGFAMSSERFGGNGLTVGVLLAAILFSLLLSLPLSGLSLQAINSGKLRRLLRPGDAGKLSYFLIFALIVCAALPCLLAFYPGVAAYDITYQWRTFYNDNMTSSHPLIHTILMCRTFQLGTVLFENFNLGIALYCFLQLLLQSAVISYAIYWLQELRLPRWAFWLVFCFYALFPVFHVLGISTTKDIIFSALFTLATIFAIKAIESKSLKDTVLFSLSLMLAVLFRSNVVFSALAVGVVILCRFAGSDNKKWMLRFLAGILAAVVAAEFTLAALQKATDASEGSTTELLSIPLQQIARVYNNDYYDLDEGDLELISRFFDTEQLENYRESISDPVKRAFFLDAFEESPESFLGLWADLGRRHPMRFLESFLFNTIPLWYIGDESMLDIKNCYLEMNFKIIEDAHPNSKLPALEALYRRFVQEGGIMQVPLLRTLAAPALYFWLIIAAAVMLIAKRKYELLLAVLFAMVYVVGLLLCPCILPRYVYAAIMSSPVIAALLIHLANGGQAAAEN